MKSVVLYTSAYCPYCIRALQLLDSKQISYDAISVDGLPEVRQQMMAKSGRHTVPQIWVGQTHVGGFDDLWALEKSGKLDPLLAEDHSTATP